MCGREVEILVGHLTHLLTLRREMLSIFSSVYVFIRESYLRRQPLWGSVFLELRWIYALLPTITAELSLEWSPTVLCYDASPWGFGVVASDMTPSSTFALGRWSERSRFRGPGATQGSHRQRALQQM